ncbi:MAG: triple tyrosine motif-containing protein [Pseudomonadota bacterium]
MGRSADIARAFWLSGAALVAGLTAFALAGAASRSAAAEPGFGNIRLSQYKHSSWNKSQGAPDSIYGLVQTPDGFLWLASRHGLFRFDGLTFEKIETIATNGTVLADPLSLFVDREGQLWVWFNGTKKFAIYRRGEFSLVPSPDLEGLVTLFTQTPDGAIWIGLPQMNMPIYRYARGRWSRIMPRTPHGPDALLGMVASRDGAVWISYVNSVQRIAPSSMTPELVFDTPRAMGKVDLDPEGAVVLAGLSTLERVSGPGGMAPFGRTPIAPLPHDIRPRHQMFDAAGNFWMASRSRGVSLLKRQSMIKAAHPQQIEQYGKADGLVSNLGAAILRDREDNIWIASASGLDRFRKVPIIVEPDLQKPAAYGDFLMSASDGSVYVAQADTLYRIRPNAHPQRAMKLASEPEGICEGADGTIWVLTRQNILGLKNGKENILPRPAGYNGALYDCAQDQDGIFWLTAGLHGIYRRQNHEWVKERRPDGSDYHVVLLARGGDKSLWATAGDTLLRRSASQWQDRLNKTSKSSIRTITGVPGGVLTVETDGLKSHGPSASNLLLQSPPVSRANGIVRLADGDLWAFSEDGLVQVLAIALGDAARGDHSRKIRIFDASAGLPDQYANLSVRSLVRGGDGRLWAATRVGTVWIHPEQIDINSKPPTVVITKLKTDRQEFRDPAITELPPGSANISIGFAAIGLAVPERIQVRYKLEGVDQDWIDPGTRRTAFYTNLAPGKYRFILTAGNEDDIWNNKGTSLEIILHPTFIQSSWFKLLLGISIIALIWLAYRLRVQQLTNRMQERFDARIAERERIARELHDTLLQGFQGLVLRFQSVANRFSSDDRTRLALEDALDRADAILAEGRARVRELRAEAAQGDLGQNLVRIADSIVGDAPPAIEFRVIGTARPITALVSDELIKIAEEAIRNTVAHANARTIAISLTYAYGCLDLTIEDDGTGFPPGHVEGSVPPGHYGLIGMNERALRAGGRMTLSSTLSGGARVNVHIPARAAYSARRQRASLREKT